MSAPCETVVPPEYVFAPISVNEPLPSLTSAPLPLMAPVKADAAPPSFVVSVPMPSATDPAPDREPTDWEKPARSSVAPAATAVGPLLKAFAIPARSIPAPTTVPAVAVFVPKRASTPAPDFVSVPAPDIPPFNVSVDAPCTSTVAPPAPSVNARAVVKLLVADSVPGLTMLPSVTLDAAFPRVPSLETTTVLPPETMVPPE